MTFNCLKFYIFIQLFHLFVNTVKGDSHLGNAKGIGEFCWSSSDCQSNSLCVKSDPGHKHRTCQCQPGYFRTNPEYWIQCIEPKRYKESCEYSQQCQHLDANSVCDTESGHFILRCLCADYHRYNHELGRCQWCQDSDCRRYHQRYSSMTTNYDSKYNRWYHNVNGIFGVWASLIIIALPICLFLFFLGIRFTKQLLHLNDNNPMIALQPNHSNLIINEQRIYVTLPSEVTPIEMPPPYDQLAKSIRLPTYEEAVNNMNC